MREGERREEEKGEKGRRKEVAKGTVNIQLFSSF